MRVPAALLIGVVTLFGTAGMADAQERTVPQERPFHGLFNTGGRTTMWLNVLTYGGLDDVEQRTTSPRGDRELATDGEYVGGTLGLNVSRLVGHASVLASGTSDVRYYPSHGDLSSLTGQTSSGSLSIGRSLKRRGALRISQSVATASFYQFNPFSGFGPRGPDDLGLPTSDFQINRGRTFSYDLSAGTDWRLTKRDLLTIDYSLRYVRFPVEDLRLLTNSAGVRLSHRATRNISIIAGYGYQIATAPDTEAAQYQRIDSGLQYQAALFDRKTSVSASGGAAIVTLRDQTSGATSQVPEAIIYASLRREVTRSWSAGLEYRREPLVVEIYSNPVYTDSILVTLRGVPGRHAALAMIGGYSRSVLSANRSDQANQTFFGTARAGWSFTRTFAPYVEYAYYGFETVANRLSAAAFTRIRRQAVRIGLNWSLPLLIPGARP